MAKKQKYIFVTGGVLSGVGKGITAASIGAVLQAKGATVSIQKCDPYLNVDAGLLDPSEHGECFVTADGAETDLDLGHYERFLDVQLSHRNTTLSGKLLAQLIDDERAGKFKGKTVQLVPHLTSAIQDAIVAAAGESEIHIVEIGGTVGDYESLSFIEAIREFSGRVGRENCLFVHVVYVPFIHTSKEFKTKPAQNALNDLRGFGIVPDSVVVRTDEPAPEKVAEKVSLFGGVPRQNVQLLANASSVYDVPLQIAANGIDELLSRFSGFTTPPDLSSWRELQQRRHEPAVRTIEIGLIARHLDNEDTYLSVTEALKAAAWQQQVELSIRWLDSQAIQSAELDALDGIIVPGGFSDQADEGALQAAQYAYEHNVPYLGIGFGCQVAAIAAAQRGDVPAATSREFTENTVAPVIEAIASDDTTAPRRQLRIGDYTSKLVKDSLCRRLYETDTVTRRYRQAYEINRDFLPAIELGGLQVSGETTKYPTISFIEANDRQFYVGTMAHIEFSSRPMKPEPLFVGFITATQEH